MFLGISVLSPRDPLSTRCACSSLTCGFRVIPLAAGEDMAGLLELMMDDYNYYSIHYCYHFYYYCE